MARPGGHIWPDRRMTPIFTPVMPIKTGSSSRNVSSRKEKKTFWSRGLETRKSSWIQDFPMPSLSELLR